MSILRAAAVVGMVLGTAVAQQQKTTQTSYGLDDVNSKDLTKEGLCKQAYHQSTCFSLVRLSQRPAPFHSVADG